MTIKKQVQEHTKIYTENGTKYRATLNIRHDDSCGNGHNTFSMTVDIYRHAGNRWIEDSFGCQHDRIEHLWPEYAHLIKWHLCSTDGPLHYIANTLFWVQEGNLNYARQTAVWPEATLDQLGDKQALSDRLPGLLTKFRHDIEAIGLNWEESADATV